MLVLLFIVLGPIVVFLSFVLYDTLRRKGEFGLRLTEPCCPKCGFKLLGEVPGTRQVEMRPNRWECPVCGFLTDQWGNELNTGSILQVGQSRTLKGAHDFENPIDMEGRSPVERVLSGDETINEH
jgi:hypothetical protein